MLLVVDEVKKHVPGVTQPNIRTLGFEEVRFRQFVYMI